MINFPKIFKLTKMTYGSISNRSKCALSILLPKTQLIKLSLSEYSTIILKSKANNTHSHPSTGLYKKPLKEVEPPSPIKEGFAIQGTDTFLNTLDILNDKEYISNLFKQTHSQKLQNDYKTLEKQSNKSDLILYIRYLESKDYKFFLRWLANNGQNFDKMYVLNILDHIVNNLNLEDATFDELEIILEIYVKYFHKNLNFLNFLEKKIIRNFNEIDSIYISLLVNNFIKLNWKTNDEYLGDLISKYPMCNFQKFNYNSIAIFMQNYSEFSFTKIHTWRYLEVCLIKIMNSLYKPRTLERILEAMIFSQKTYGINFTIIEIIQRNLLTKFYSNYLSKIDLVSVSLLVEGKYIQDEFVINNLKKMILKNNFTDVNEYGFLLKSYKNLFLAFNEKNENWINLINKTLNDVIDTMSGEELFEMFECLIESKFIQSFDFRAITQDCFEKMKNSNFAYGKMLTVVNEICECENFMKNDKKMLSEFDLKKFLVRKEFYSIFKNEIFVNLGNFLYKNHIISNRNKFYKDIEEFFIEMLKEKLNSNYEDYKLAILTIPMYFNASEISSQIALENLKTHWEEFLSKSSQKSEEESVMTNILVNEKILALSETFIANDQIVIDLDSPNAKTLKEIKEYSNFSYSQMENMYNCKFISSDCENFYENLQ